MKKWKLILPIIAGILCVLVLFFVYENTKTIKLSKDEYTNAIKKVLDDSSTVNKDLKISKTILVGEDIDFNSIDINKVRSDISTYQNDIAYLDKASDYYAKNTLYSKDINDLVKSDQAISLVAKGFIDDVKTQNTNALKQDETDWMDQTNSWIRSEVVVEFDLKKQH